MSRARQAGRSAALLGLAALAACSSAPPAPPQSSAAARSVISPERGGRGNPPFYEVFGERYYVLQSSEGYRERGIASWYGPDFHGKPTSGGEIYDMHALTAAHKTLPIPTWVEVTNLANKRSVIVKVNDRGPFVDDRLIDLSFRAAQELDMIRTGTALVQVRALGAPAALPAEPRPLQAAAREEARGGFSLISEARAGTLGPDDLAPVSRQGIYVQVGAFSEHDNAVRLVARLRQQGFRDSFVVSSSDARPIHRVRIGPLNDAAEFDRMRRTLRSKGFGESRLVMEN